MASASNENLYQKLAKIRKQVEVIQKNKSGYGYKYVSDDEILSKVTAFLSKYDLSLIPSIVPNTMKVEPYCTVKTKTTKNGEPYSENVNEVLVSAEMKFTWLNNQDPGEQLTIPWIMVGHQSDASQSLGSGLTYAMRYFLLKFFNIATPDSDPDSWRSKQKQAADEEDKMIAEQIIQAFDGLLRSYLAANPEKSEEAKQFISKFVKNGNYKAITESALAGRLLSDFKENFNIKE